MKSQFKIGIVSAGAAGVAFSAALRSVGHTVIGVSVDDDAQREYVDAVLPGVPSAAPHDVVAAADVVILADNGRLEYWDNYCADMWQPGQIVVHMAPGYGHDILTAAAAHGALTFALHPLCHLTGTSLDVGSLHGVAWALTCSPRVVAIGAALIDDVGGYPVPIAATDRPAYAQMLEDLDAAMKDALQLALRACAAYGVSEPGEFLRSYVLDTVHAAMASTAYNQDA